MKHLRWLRWLTGAAAIFLFFAALIFSYAVGVSQDALDRVTEYDWPTSALQGRNEAAEMELHVTQLALLGNQPGRAAAVMWHQILLSRIRSWGNSDFRQFIEADPRLLAQYNALVSDMDSLGRTLLQFDDERAAADALAEAGGIADAVEQAGVIKQAVNRLAMRALSHGLSERTQARADLRTKQNAQKFLNGSLFAAGLILLLVTVLQNRALVRSNAKIASSAKQLVESQAELSSVLASTTDGVFSMDTHWRITYANQNAIDFLFSCREFLGISLWKLLPDMVGSKFDNLFRTAMERQAAEKTELYYASSGSWIEVHAHPAPDKLTVFFRDVTEQRRIEERFRHVAQASSDLIFDSDLTTGVIWVNDAAFWLPDYPPGPQEVPRDAWVDSVHPDDRDETLAQMEKTIQSGRGFWDGEYRLRNRDGQYVPVRDRANILRNDTGEPVRMIGNMIDLSEQKSLEAQLRQSQRLDAVGQLTGGVAHDFNNLLTIIIGNIELLQDSLDQKDPLRRFADMSAQAADRGAELTNRLLAFSRKQPLQPQVIDVNTVICGVQDMLRRTLGETIDIEIALADDLWPTEIDRAQVEAALLNLSINSRDAMADGGSLTIETVNVSLDEDYVASEPDLTAGKFILIAVSDTGHGIPKDQIERVFEPFFTTKSMAQGTGLGLSMVYGFVKQTGGHVRIYSEQGEGTTVKMYFPRYVGKHTARETDVDHKTVQSGQETVLVVEDDKLILQQLTMQLTGLATRW